MVIDLVIFILVLGLLVFFHELGHFLAAKACGIYVDRFSLGMPPRVFGVRWGDTDYCIGALPLGGYVKMAGQEDTPLSEEEREQTYGHVPEDRWFNNKPVWQRFIVIAAGPLMNMVLAVLLYGIVAGFGAYVRESDVDNRIGQVAPDSPASAAPLFAMSADGAMPNTNRPPDATGWETGDRIVSIDGSRVRNIMDVGMDALLGGGKVMNVVLERTAPDGKVTRYLSPAAPKPVAEIKRVRFGVNPFDTALVDSVVSGSPAEAQGVRKGDVIARANGKIVDSATFIDLVEKVPEGGTVALDIRRGEETIPVTIQPSTIGRMLGLSIWSSWDLNQELDENAQPVVIGVTKEVQDTTGIERRDIIETIDGKPATIALLNDFERTHPSGTVSVEIRRPAILFGALRKESHLTLNLPITPVRAIGVQLGAMMVFHRVPPAEVIPEAFSLSYQALARTLRTLQMLVTGGVSPKELGGPVLIYQITTAAARAGYSWLLSTTAFISANLCVFNLLPLPILDGSLLVYLIIEGIRRKPIDMRILERIQQVGLVMIVCLLLYVTFNDVSRWVTNLLP